MLEKVYAYVVEATKLELSDQGNSLYISEQLQLSRNMVSQYLNQLFAEGRLLKINTRPVVFYDGDTIEDMYGVSLHQREFISLEEFQKALQPHQPQDFEKLIGYDESLASLVNQCKATISYPPSGLPLLLYGPTGTGKSFLAQLMYEYAINQGLIAEDRNFLIVNCSEYANNPELLTANLFGHKKGAFTGADRDNPGLIKLAEGGVLFLDEVHCLKAECQEKLFLFMDKGIYHMVGDNEKWYTSSVRLIFATTEKPQEVLLKTLLRRIPMIVTVPSLAERGSHERLQLIHSIFQDEEKRIHKSIHISSLVYRLLLSCECEGNIGELKNAIQASCVNALFASDQKSSILEIRAFNLPEKLRERKDSGKSVSRESQRMNPVHELKSFVSKEHPIIQLLEHILAAFQAPHEFLVCLDEAGKAMHSYQEATMLRSSAALSGNEYVQGIVSNIFDMLSLRYGFKYVNNDLIAITACIADCMQNTLELGNWQEANRKQMAALQKFLKQKLAREYAIAGEIREHLENNLDLKFEDMISVILCLHLKLLNRMQDLNKRIGIIIAHGFSTASSLADAVNKFLGRYVFDSIDMPLHVTTQEIIERLNRYLSKIGRFEELFLLVDMGSLEDLYKGIENQNANIGIMNNVTTKLALEIGNGMIQGTGMQEIFDAVQTYSAYHYHIVEHRRKEQVILCSCASGIGTAEKLKTILTDSLPHNFPIQVLTYDYNTLLEKQMHDAFFDTYEVICIVGTLNPNIEGIRFIPIEDLIINDTMVALNIYFRDYMREEEMKTFQQNILKNFSLSNIMNNLTILNPNKLLEHVADAIDKLQLELGLRFTNNTCFGLYVHICCLIERLVTRREIDIFTDIEDFAQQEAAFIQCVKHAFSVVEEYYGVEIPVEEIGYIFNYVEHDDGY